MRRQFITALLLFAPCAGVAAAQDTTQSQPRDTSMQRMRTEDQNRLNDQNRLTDEVVLMKMHKNNLMEIRMGQLAQRNARAAKVRSYGQRLVRDHQAADVKVMATAQQLGITLKDEMDSTGNHDAMRRHNEMRDPARHNEMRDPAMKHDTTMRADTTNKRWNQTDTTMRDTTAMRNRNNDTTQSMAPGTQYGNRTSDSTHAQGADTTSHMEHGRMAKLATLRGAQFDTAFAMVMLQGHQKTVAMLEQAQQQVQRDEVKSLITSTLPTVREHLRLAESLAGAAARTTSSQ